MAAGRYDWVLEQGTTLSKRIDVSEVFPSLDGYVARLQVRPSVASATVYMDIASNTSGITIDTTNRYVTLNLLASSTAGQTWDVGVYDLELVSSGGTVTRLLEGSVVNSKEVTR